MSCPKCGLPVWRVEQPNGKPLLIDPAVDDDGSVMLFRRQVDGLGTTKLLCEVLPGPQAAAARAVGEQLYALHSLSCAASPFRKPNPMPPAIREHLESKGWLSTNAGRRND